MKSQWDDALAERFFKRLGRPRNKGQYLCIQAPMLVRARPDVALDLLERYFALPPQLDQAQAHVDRAAALMALGQLDVSAAPPPGP